MRPRWPVRRGSAESGRNRPAPSLRRLAGVALVAVPLLWAAAAGAREADTRRDLVIVPPVSGITLEQAANKVRSQTGGRVLSATPVQNGGERGYNVRVLVDGKRVKQFYVDSNGRMSSR